MSRFSSLTAVGFFFFLTACAQQVTEDQEPIKIGGAFALSDFGAEWGEAELNGATLAIEEQNARGGIRGRKVELVAEDTATNALKTVTATRKLIDIDQVEVMVGPTWFDSFAGPAPIADQEEVVMLTPSAAITAVQGDNPHPYVFSTWFRSDEESREIARYLAKIGQKRIAFFFGLDPFWDDVSAKAREEAQKLGVEIVKDITVQGNDSDFRTMLTQLKKIEPDVILFGFNNKKQFAAFLKQRAEIYPNSPLFTTEYIEEFLDNPDYAPLLAPMWYIAPKVEESAFTKKYRDRFGKDPVFSASNSYDATNMILEAFKLGKTTGPAIREFLAENMFETVTFGKLKFDEIGGVKGGAFIIKEVK
ncbi:ABC transporter substrate-binding protein [Candidatus Peregrinibacteria bacterium]|nr:ABC transporter substrate-binding protein [Candidatus Peregrinibacteria bacterium]